MTIRPMEVEDLPSLQALWASQPGIRLRGADSPEALAAFLQRHPGLSFVAEHEGRIVGGVIAGHDGRRGNLMHLVVAPDVRLRGIGRGLVDHSVLALAECGILKSHIYIRLDNTGAEAFWRACGWFLRDDIRMFSHVHGNDPDV